MVRTWGVFWGVRWVIEGIVRFQSYGLVFVELVVSFLVGWLEMAARWVGKPAGW